MIGFQLFLTLAPLQPVAMCSEGAAVLKRRFPSSPTSRFAFPKVFKSAAVGLLLFFSLAQASPPEGYFYLTNKQLEAGTYVLEGNLREAESPHYGSAIMGKRTARADQVWKAIPIDEDYFYLTNREMEGSELVLEGNDGEGDGDEGGPSAWSMLWARGTPFLTDKAGQSGQMWKAIPLGDGSFQLTTNYREQEGLVLEATAGGVPLQLAEISEGSPAQEWTFRPALEVAQSSLWPEIEPSPPAKLREMADSLQHELVSATAQKGGVGIPYVGFFVGEEGQCLMPLDPMVAEPTPAFYLHSREDNRVIDPPVVLGVFPAENLALVKFDHRPMHVLQIATEEPAVGTWLALPEPLPPNAWRHLYGPIVGLSPTGAAPTIFAGKEESEPLEVFSIGLGRSAPTSKATVWGVPFLNDEGEVVGCIRGTMRFPEQDYTLVMPLSGFPTRIAEALKASGKSAIPLAPSAAEIESAVYSDESRRVTAAIRDSDYPAASEAARDLVQRYPDSMYALSTELLVLAQLARRRAFPVDQLLEATRQFQVHEGMQPWTEASRLLLVADALYVVGRSDEAIKMLRRCDEIYPQSMASSQLGGIYVQIKDYRSAIHYYRRAALLEPGRIAWAATLEELWTRQGNLDEALKWARRSQELRGLFSGSVNIR